VYVYAAILGSLLGWRVWNKFRTKSLSIEKMNEIIADSWAGKR
jgi:hypothetical protein